MIKLIAFKLFIVLIAVNVFSQFSNDDYNSALKAALIFFDANRCGPDAGKDNYFNWRGACHTGDAVPGGYHDAGDHVKFGLPAAWSCATIAWATYEFPEIFAPVKDRNEKVLRYFADFFVRCLKGNKFVYQIGSGGGDHGYWGPPEKQGNGNRTVKSAPPGAEVLAQTAAALALMNILYKDGTYLSTAKTLYNLAKANIKSKYDGGQFYKSTSTYDDMVWASIWLSKATGDDSYMEKADEWMDIKNDFGDDPYNKKWGPAWDDMTVFNLVKMAEITGNDKYIQGLKNNFAWFQTIPSSPGGIPIFHNWAVLRYASAEAGAGFLAYKLIGNGALNELGGKIINYCLGTNPAKRSYLTGWGNSPPKHPHHRANQPDEHSSATNNLYGALVGGPDINDKYVDDVTQYIYTEVALDYNASFILGLASYMWYKNGGEPANQAPSVQITSPLNGVALPIGATIKVNVEAKDKEGKVAKIELFKGDELLKSSTTSPLIYEYKSSSAGEFVLRATATDDEGKVGKSPQVKAEFTAPCTPGEIMSTKGWRATASHSSQNADEGPGSALDGKKETRWGSGAGQSDGMWFQIDMGYPRTVNQVIVDASGSGSDYPGSIEVYAGNDPDKFDDPVATATGDKITTIKFSQAVYAQILRLICKQPTGGFWWSIHEIQVPCVKSTAVDNFSVKNVVKDNSIGINAFTQNNAVIVKYNLPESGRVTIEAYSPAGVRLGILESGIKNAGSHTIISNMPQRSSNVVIYRMKFGNSVYEKKAVLLN